jgi:hypothetical protein
MLAEWYRAFAAVGHSDQREDRLWMAEYLERKADELEQLCCERSQPNATLGSVSL